MLCRFGQRSYSTLQLHTSISNKNGHLQYSSLPRVGENQEMETL